MYFCWWALWENCKKTYLKWQITNPIRFFLICGTDGIRATNEEHLSSSLNECFRLQKQYSSSKQLLTRLQFDNRSILVELSNLSHGNFQLLFPACFPACSRQHFLPQVPHGQCLSSRIATCVWRQKCCLPSALSLKILCLGFLHLKVQPYLSCLFKG